MTYDVLETAQMDAIRKERLAKLEAAHYAQKLALAETEAALSELRSNTTHIEAMLQ
jgi:hypothetical protein